MDTFYTTYTGRLPSKYRNKRVASLKKMHSDIGSQWIFFRRGVTWSPTDVYIYRHTKNIQTDIHRDKRVSTPTDIVKQQVVNNCLATLVVHHTNGSIAPSVMYVILNLSAKMQVLFQIN